MHVNGRYRAHTSAHEILNTVAENVEWCDEDRGHAPPPERCVDQSVLPKDIMNARLAKMALR